VGDLAEAERLLVDGTLAYPACAGVMRVMRHARWWTWQRADSPTYHRLLLAADRPTHCP